MQKEGGGNMRVAIVGAALSANKGASAMAESVIAALPDRLGPCEFDLLTTYPAEDSVLVDDPAVRVVSLTPPRLAALDVPLALLAGTLRRLRMPYRWLLRTEALRALDRADVVVDVAGISFVDGRGLPTLTYNTLMTGLPLLLGRPVVKTAQAMGPFERPLNRLCARLVLRRLARVCARGAGTRAHLDSLGLDNVVDAADLAFALPERAELPPEVTAPLGEAIDQDFVLVMPSQVVAGLCEKAGIAYVEAMATVVADVHGKLGLPVVIVPHSYRAGQGRSRMNDGPVTRELAAACQGDGVHLLDLDLRPQVLRTLVDRASLLLTSRFHGMVSGMATATPTVVVGWSHKYREVMSVFGVERFGLSHEALATPTTVVETVVDAWNGRDAARATMTEARPQVTAAAARNFDAIADVLAESDRS